MTGYRTIVAPYDLHYHLSTCLDRCYLLGHPGRLASESHASLHRHISHDTEAVSPAVKMAKITASCYESNLESSHHRLLTQTCLYSRESRVSGLVEEGINETLVSFLLEGLTVLRG